MTGRPIGLILGAAAGGLLAAAVLAPAVATADDLIDVPDVFSFEPTQVTGTPPYSPLEVMGTEKWNLFDLTTNTLKQPDVLQGVDTETAFGSFTNDAFSSTGLNVDLANFGGGWENEWFEFYSASEPAHPVMADLLITPFGDFSLLGTWPLTA